MKPNFTLSDLDPSIIIEPKNQAKSAVIWLHGLGADGHDFEGILPQLNLPLEHDIRFIFPHAPVQPVTVNGGMVMRSWYDILSMSIADRVDIEGVEQSSAILNELIEQQVKEGIAAQHIVLAGFSQGGLIALHTGLNAKYTLAGVMALSTYYPEACLKSDKVFKTEMPIFMAHGSYDQVIPLNIAESSRNLLIEQGYDVEWRTYPMEHSVCMAEIEQISAWLQDKLLKEVLIK